MIPCWYCGSVEPGPRIREHQTPVSRGGTDDPENLVPACQSCNRIKGSRTVEEWHEDIERGFRRDMEPYACADGSLRYPPLCLADRLPHLFFGQKNDVPKRWHEKFQVSCVRCATPSDLVRSWKDLRLAGWEPSYMVYVAEFLGERRWLCGPCYPKAEAEEEERLARRDRYPMSPLDDRFDLEGSC